MKKYHPYGVNSTTKNSIASILSFKYNVETIYQKLRTLNPNKSKNRFFYYFLIKLSYQVKDRYLNRIKLKPNISIKRRNYLMKRRRLTIHMHNYNYIYLPLTINLSYNIINIIIVSYNCCIRVEIVGRCTTS